MMGNHLLLNIPSKMVMVKTNFRTEFYLDNKLKENIDILLDGLRQDDDFLLVIDGPEGAGKSLFARQIGFYCAQKLGTNFSVENIHFNLKSYVDFSLESEKYTVLILDEARKILNRKRSMSYEVVKFTNYLSECRKKRQVHILCLPGYHDLDKYVALWRMKGIIHVMKYFVESEEYESGFKIKRGEFLAFFKPKDLQFYYDKPYNYPKKYDIKGIFKDIDTVIREEYEEKKDGNLFDKYHSSKEKEKENALVIRYRNFILKLIKRLQNDYNFQIKDLSVLGGWGERGLYNLINFEKSKSE